MGLTKRVLFEVIVEVADTYDNFEEEYYNEETDEYTYTSDDERFLEDIKENLRIAVKDGWDGESSLRKSEIQLISSRTI